MSGVKPLLPPMMCLKAALPFTFSTSFRDYQNLGRCQFEILGVNLIILLKLNINVVKLCSK